MGTAVTNIALDPHSLWKWYLDHFDNFAGLDRCNIILQFLIVSSSSSSSSGSSNGNGNAENMWDSLCNEIWYHALYLDCTLYMSLTTSSNNASAAALSLEEIEDLLRQSYLYMILEQITEDLRISKIPSNENIVKNADDL